MLASTLLALLPPPLKNFLLKQRQHLECIKVCPPHGKPHSWTCVGLYHTTESVKLSQQHSPFLPHPGKQDCPGAVCKNASGRIQSRPKRERQVFLQKIQQSACAFVLLLRVLVLRGHACSGASAASCYRHSSVPAPKPLQSSFQKSKLYRLHPPK